MADKNIQMKHNANGIEHNVFPKTKAELVSFEDGKTFQQKYDTGELAGPKGDTGAKGATGATGATGPKGADGLTTSIAVNGSTYTHSSGKITLPDYLKREAVNTVNTGANILTVSGSTRSSFIRKFSDQGGLSMVSDSSTVLYGGDNYQLMMDGIGFGASTTSEQVVIGADNNIRIIANMQTDYATSKEFTFATNGRLTAPNDMYVGANRVYHAGNKPTAADVGALATNGTAVSSTKLATVRTINGTNFDGTANITTANWGTARTLTIGSTGKSVNGSGNISWSLSEIGAASSNHGHTSLTGLTSLQFGDSTISKYSHSVSDGIRLNAIHLTLAGSDGIKMEGNAQITNNLTVSNTLTVSTAIYGPNNIALSRGSIYCGTVQASLTCDYLRFGTNIVASDTSKRIHMIDTGGNGATVYMDTVITRAFGNGGTTLMHNNLDGNGKNLGHSGSKFNQLSAKAVYGDTGSVSDISAKENIRKVVDSETVPLSIDIEQENQKTLDSSYDISRPEMFNFIKNDLQLYHYNYKHEEQFEIEGAFNNKVGFIANEVAENKVGRTFVSEHEGMLAYNLNNYVFLLTGALQESIKKIDELETRITVLEK